MRLQEPVRERGTTGPHALDKEALSKLSPREHEVLSFASWGYLDKQISSEMGVSLNTLRTYWTRIRSKVGEVPRSALAVAYVEHAAGNPDVNVEGFDWEIDFDTETMHRLSDKPSPLGTTPGQVITLTEALSMIHPDDAPRVRESLRSLREGSVPALTYAFRVITPNGIVVASSYVQAVKDSGGRVTKILGRQVPNLDLRTPTIESVGIGHWQCYIPTKTLTADSGFCAIFRVDPKDPRWPENVFDRFPPDDVAYFRSLVQDTVTSGVDHQRRTHRLIFEGGAEIWVTTHVRIEYEGEKPIRALGTVITFC
jgi:DNA-binding CsgD family transcriptional regulator